VGARCVSDGISYSASGHESKSFLEKRFTPACSGYAFAFSPIVVPFHLRALCAPLHSRSPAPHPRQTSLGLPNRFQTEAALNLVRGLLGWTTLGLAGAVPLGGLATGEFVLFVSYISCELALPISPFFLLLFEELGLQLQHLTPHSILQAAIFAHFFVLVKSGKAKDHLSAYYFQTRPDSASAYISSLGGARWEN
jgi:hypothetical protein